MQQVANSDAAAVATFCTVEREAQSSIIIYTGPRRTRREATRAMLFACVGLSAYISIHNNNSKNKQRGRRFGRDTVCDFRKTSSPPPPPPPRQRRTHVTLSLPHPPPPTHRHNHSRRVRLLYHFIRSPPQPDFRCVPCTTTAAAARRRSRTRRAMARVSSGEKLTRVSVCTT